MILSRASTAKITTYRAILCFALFYCYELWAVPGNLRLDPPIPLKGQTAYDLDSEFFIATKNFSKDSQTIESAGGKYQYLKVSPSIEFSLGGNHQVHLSGDFVNSQSVDSSFTRNNTNLSEVSLGYRYSFRWLRLLWIPELIGIAPLFSIKDNTDQSLLGEGASAAEPGLWLIKNYFRTRFFLRGSYEWRSGGRAQLAHFMFGASYRTVGQYRYAIDLNGFSTVAEDIYTNDQTKRLQVINSANAGSYKYYSINPQSLAAHVSIAMPIVGSHFIELGYQKDLNGQFYAAGDTVLLRWTFTSSAIPGAKSVAEPKFELDYEPVDQNLFKEE